jgi:hypothetical protein
LNLQEWAFVFVFLGIFLMPFGHFIAQALVSLLALFRHGVLHLLAHLTGVKHFTFLFFNELIASLFLYIYYNPVLV